MGQLTADEEYHEKERAAFREYVDTAHRDLGLDKGKCNLPWKEYCKRHSQAWHEYCRKERILKEERRDRKKREKG